MFEQVQIASVASLLDMQLSHKPMKTPDTSLSTVGIQLELCILNLYE
jgi:hypothetical protein